MMKDMLQRHDSVNINEVYNFCPVARFKFINAIGASKI